MSTNPRLHHGHGRNRTSRSSRSELAATARCYVVEPALTYDDVMTARGWDRRHRRYRKSRR